MKAIKAMDSQQSEETPTTPSSASKKPPQKKKRALMKPATPTDLSSDEDFQPTSSSTSSDSEASQETKRKSKAAEYTTSIIQLDDGWPIDLITHVKALNGVGITLMNFIALNTASNLAKLVQIILDRFHRPQTYPDLRKFFSKDGTLEGKLDLKKIIRLLEDLKHKNYELNTIDDQGKNALDKYLEYKKARRSGVEILIEAGVKIGVRQIKALQEKLTKTTDRGKRVAIRYLIDKLSMADQGTPRAIESNDDEEEYDADYEDQLPMPTHQTHPEVFNKPQPTEPYTSEQGTAATAAPVHLIHPSLVELLLHLKPIDSWNLCYEVFPALIPAYNSFVANSTAANLVTLADKIHSEFFPAMSIDSVIEIGAKLLRNTKKNLNIKNEQGKNALQICMESNQASVLSLRILIRAGVNVNVYTLDVIDQMLRRVNQKLDIDEISKARIRGAISCIKVEITRMNDTQTLQSQ